MVSTPEKIAHDILDACNAHDIERAVSFYSPGYEGTDISQASPHIGREGMHKTLSAYLEAFPDLQIRSEETVSDGNRVVVMWQAQGTHRGKLLNIPPSGRKVKSRGVAVLTLENEQVTRAFYIWDVAGVLREIGLLPDL